MKKQLMGALLAASLGLSGSLAQASAILGFGGKIFATGGDVVVDILPSSSGFDNKIELFYSYTDANKNLVNKTFIGIDNQPATVNLGAFDAGMELVFGIISPQGTFVMGQAGRNPDKKVHGWVAGSPTKSGFIESFLVGFEDLWKGGDKDFNDAIFRVNQTAAAVPEPASLGLLAAGLIGLGLVRRKQRA